MKISRLKILGPYCLALIAGLLIPLSLAPFNYHLVAFVSPALLLLCLRKASVGKSTLLGLCYGIGQFGLGASWIYVSIHDYGPASMPLALTLTLLFVSAMSLYPAIFCASLVKLLPTSNFRRTILAFPAVWVLCDLLRGWAFTGFPWLYIGYSQLDTNLSDLAPIGGIWLVSWATVMTASLIYAIFEYIYDSKANKTLFVALLGLLIVVWGGAFYAHKHPTWTLPYKAPLQVSLIQGNIPQWDRWDPDNTSTIIDKYQKMTQKALDNPLPPELVIWPESAIPLPLSQAQNILINLDRTFKQKNSTLITGIPMEAPNQRYYNGVLALGRGSGSYEKQHLVPFGEYVPLERFLRGLIGFFDLPMSAFIPGESLPPLRARDLQLSAAICYEIAYPNFIQAMTPADLILTLSNDTWFGRSIGPHQHLQIAQFRALETGRYVLRATNSGFSAIIAPNGKIQSIAPAFEDFILNDTVQAMQFTTPWIDYGVQPLLMALLGLVLLALIPTKKH